MKNNGHLRVHTFIIICITAYIAQDRFLSELLCKAGVQKTHYYHQSQESAFLISDLEHGPTVLLMIGRVLRLHA